MDGFFFFFLCTLFFIIVSDQYDVYVVRDASSMWIVPRRFQDTYNAKMLIADAPPS